MKNLFKTLILPTVVTFCAILFVGCGNLLDYDISGITFESKTVLYNGSAQSLAIAGNLPEGVTVSYEYYQEGTKLSGEPIDVGEYKVVAKFSGDTKHYNPIENKEATLTINKGWLNVSFGSKQFQNVLGDKEDLDTTKVFKNNNDGTFTFEFDDNKYYICVTSEDAGNYEISLYNALNADGSINPEYECDGLISDINKPIYALVEYVGDDENIIKNYKTSAIFSIMLTKRVANLYSASDLAQMRVDIEEHSYEYRLNTIYNLMNDIDFAEGEEKGLWYIPAAYYPNDTGKSFCSEFNGNGHTIKNFKITEDSLPNLSSLSAGDTMIGFFGFVTDSHIHDVNFVDFDVDVDCYQIYENLLIDNPTATPKQTFFGMVAADVDEVASVDIGTVVSTNISKFENIKVENGNIKINAADKAFCGIMVGSDSTGDGNNAGIRDNLDAKNVKLTVINAHSADATLVVADTLRVGGIAGEIGNKGEGVTYSNCDLENVEIHVGAHEEGQEEKSTTMNVGAFIGHCRSNTIMSNCHISDFVVDAYAKNKKNVKMGGYYGQGDKNLTMESCSHTNPKTSEEIGVETTTGIISYIKTAAGWTANDQKWAAKFEPTE